jgi:hypothetical protein
MTVNEEYRKTLTAARAELDSLVEQREEIERRIGQLKQAIVALVPLGEDEDKSAFGFDLKTIQVEVQAMGITDTCREILKAAGHGMNPIEVKEKIVQLKPEFAKQKNLMASVHTVLKRLVPAEVSSFIGKEGETLYRWKQRYRHGHVRPGHTIHKLKTHGLVAETAVPVYPVSNKRKITLEE